MNQQIKVLLADDHPMFLEGVFNALQKFQQLQVVAQCTDGAAVEKFISQSTVDVAVLDVNMPVKSGLELARLIKKEYSHIRIVFLTMYHPGALEGETWTPLAQGYVLKNSGSQVLVEAIEAVHSGKPYLDPKLKELMPVAPAHFIPPQVKLSTREKQIIRLVVQGKGNREMAEELFISELTIKTHRKNIYEKLDIKNVAELINAVHQGNIRLDE